MYVYTSIGKTLYSLDNIMLAHFRFYFGMIAQIIIFLLSGLIVEHYQTAMAQRRIRYMIILKLADIEVPNNHPKGLMNKS